MLRSVIQLRRSKGLALPMILMREIRTKSRGANLSNHPTTKTSTSAQHSKKANSINHILFNNKPTRDDSTDSVTLLAGDDVISPIDNINKTFTEEVTKRGLTKLEMNDGDQMILEMLNVSRPGSPTDLRYAEQSKLMKTLGNDEDQKLRSLCAFLVTEIQYQLFQPEEEQIDTMYGRSDNEGAAKRGKSRKGKGKKNGNGDTEKEFTEMAEYEFRQTFFAAEGNSEASGISNIELKFKVINRLLDGLLKKRGGLLVLPPELTVQVFQLAQFILDDEDLKMRTRYLSGKLIYGLKKFDFDFVSESQFIEALILKGENDYARELLEKKKEKVNQRFWYELMIVNELESGNLRHAESLVELIAKRFQSPYLDVRIFQLFVDKYSEINDLENLKKWIEKCCDLILNKGGFTQGEPEDQEPMFNLEEEQALELLTKEKPIEKEEFFKIIEILFKENDFFQSELIVSAVEFYLSQPDTFINEITPLLIKYRFKTSQLIPIFEKSTKPYVWELLIQYHKEISTTSAAPPASQIEFFEQLFEYDKTRVIDLNTMLKRTEQVIEAEGYISSTIAYHLIQELLKHNKTGEALKMLKQMELVAVNNDNISSSSILPAAEPKHYLPFLAKYGRSNKFQTFKRLLTKFEAEVPTPGNTKNDQNTSQFKYNPIILTQIVNSLSKMKRHRQLILLINRILIEDLAHQDPNYIFSSEAYSERKLYSSMWKGISDTLVAIKFGKVAGTEDKAIVRDFPNLRLLFMRMIYDKVVPTVKDYHNILKSFLLVKGGNDSSDEKFYSIPCVLKYLNKKHNFALMPETERLLQNYTNFGTSRNNNESNSFISNKTENSIENSEPDDEKDINILQQKLLNELHLRTDTNNNKTFDPFKQSNIDNENESNLDKPLLDLTPDIPETPTVKITNHKTDLIWEYNYYLTLKYIILKNGEFNYDIAVKVFRDFELIVPTENEIEELMKKYEGIKY